MAAVHRWLRSGRVEILFWYVFAHKFRVNPHFDLEHDYIIRKGIWRRIQRYTVRTEILPTFHTGVECISQHHYAYWNQCMRRCRKCSNPCQKQPLPLEACGPPSNTWMPWPTPLTTPNDSSIALRTSTQRRNKVPIGYNGTPQIHPPKCPFRFDDHHQNLIHRFQARPHSPRQTASQSIHVCGHSSYLRTDRRKRRDECSVPSALRSVERRANNCCHCLLQNTVSIEHFVVSLLFSFVAVMPHSYKVKTQNKWLSWLTGVYSVQFQFHYYYKYNHFMALWTLFGTTQVSRCRKKHSSTHTCCGYQSSLICLLHLLRYMASLYSLCAWQSFSTIFLQ